MRLRWRMRDAMATVAVSAIYLAAIHSLTLGPSGDTFMLAQQFVAMILLFFIMPFHIMAAWARFIARKGWSAKRAPWRTRSPRDEIRG
jgi:hypothetical protein